MASMIGLKRILISFFIVLFCISMNGQDVPNYREGEVVFLDRFASNVNQWPIYYSKIKKGRYILETIGNDPPIETSRIIHLDRSRPYIITFKFSIEWNRKNQPMGFIWNMGFDDCYRFAFDKEGYGAVLRVSNGREDFLTPWEKVQGWVPRHEMNTLNILSADGSYILILNGRPIAKAPSLGSLNQRVGFFLGQHSEMKVTELRVSYLKES